VEWARTHPSCHCVDLLLEIQPGPVFRSVRSFGYQQVRVGSVGTIFGLTHRALWTHRGVLVECGLMHKSCKEVDVWLSEPWIVGIEGILCHRFGLFRWLDGSLCTNNGIVNDAKKNFVQKGTPLLSSSEVLHCLCQDLTKAERSSFDRQQEQNLFLEITLPGHSLRQLVSWWDLENSGCSGAWTHKAYRKIWEAYNAEQKWCSLDSLQKNTCGFLARGISRPLSYLLPLLLQSFVGFPPLQGY